jgi:hypothetical protein
MYVVSIEYISSSGIKKNADINAYSASDNNEQLADKITILAGQINAANYRFLKLIAEFDRCVAWEGPGIRSCVYWLNWKCER